eukprot:2314828-Prymnesium_polylepis.1
MLGGDVHGGHRPPLVFGIINPYFVIPRREAGRRGGARIQQRGSHGGGRTQRRDRPADTAAETAAPHTN